MRTKLLHLLVFVMCMFMPMKASAQMSQFQSLYIMNFMKNINWGSNVDNDLVITILNDQALYSEMAKVVQTKRIGVRSVNVVLVNRAQDVAKSDVIVIGTSKSRECAEIRRVHNASTLIVSCASGRCAMGAAICFTDTNGKLSFEISERNINEQGLNVSSKLYNLGIKVN